jgi:hypothetical protein
MIMTQEQVILKAQDQFEQVQHFIRQASSEGRRIDQVESDLWGRMLEIGLRLLEGYVAGYEQGDLGPTLEHEGRVVRRLDQLHVRRYVSVFGELAISRYVYGTRETQKHEVIPLDGILALPDSEFSYVLQDWDQGFCVESSYGQSRCQIERILRIGQSVLSLEQMNGQMALAAEGFWVSEAPPTSETEGPIMVLTADGKGVPMRREGGCDKPVRLKKGQKANRKRQACIGGVYTIEPFTRTAEDVVNELLRDQRREQRPRPQNKKLRAELTRPIEGQEVNGKDRIFGWFAEQIRCRNADHRKPIVCLMDGDRALWEKVKWLMVIVGVPILCILDVFHVLEYLWSAAYCFHPEGSSQAEAFVTDRLRRLLHGEAGYVIGGLRQMQTKHKLSKSKREQLSKIITYLANNQAYMRYDVCLSEGYPIGSGVVEGACRHVVKDRMEGTGMCWCIPGAQAMLHLRAIHLNGDWDAFQKYHIKTDMRKLYPYRRLVRRLYRKTG